ncbi:MAG: hypothetical protein IPM79_22000 [Polyangiaceae bacterium]|jgi:hypothetical protein|nr:hypothetical protein [Polyangiaceae bacterium]MBK8940218.1 hypothetical protein [Polyangiaceae bacterium]
MGQAACVKVAWLALFVLCGACQGKIEPGPGPGPASAPAAAASSARGFVPPELPVAPPTKAGPRPATHTSSAPAP